MNTPEHSTQIYTVAGLTREIKSLLENRYPFLWVTGEISNYAVPASGHSYFSLKDSQAVISCVMFKNQKRHLKFKPENGMKVTGMARISLYEPRGSYQLIFEHMAPDGAGALQVAFEQLKTKLASQGLFDREHKKTLPFLPRRISVITSGTGAAVRDILHVAGRRFPGCPLEVVPVKVQGQDAELEIVHAIEMVNKINRSDLILLARGGGSLEDLMAFNTEGVAYAIFNSQLPVITGVGHETDFTIADFVSDLRAPTPSAAAEMALPDQRQLRQTVLAHEQALEMSMKKRMEYLEQRLDDLTGRLKSPSRVARELADKITALKQRLNGAMIRKISHRQERLSWAIRSLDSTLPRLNLPESAGRISALIQALDQGLAHTIENHKARVNGLAARLDALNPLAVLDRGYSITRTLPAGKVICDADTITPEDRVEIILAKGRLVTRVEETHGQENL